MRKNLRFLLICLKNCDCGLGGSDIISLPTRLGSSKNRSCSQPQTTLLQKNVSSIPSFHCTGHCAPSVSEHGHSLTSSSWQTLIHTMIPITECCQRNQSWPPQAAPNDKAKVVIPSAEKFRRSSIYGGYRTRTKLQARSKEPTYNHECR